LILSVVGLYGVIADTTSQRTREIGIRVALGANRRHIVRPFVGDGLAWTSIGIVLGTAAALALTGSLRSLLFAVSPGDPLTLAAVAAMLVAVSLVATFAPVRRATRIAASTALRAD
jgi:ABC-type antimicrobial peptide transport system permease subunit